jgi:hypothetical protein
VGPAGRSLSTDRQAGQAKSDKGHKEEIRHGLETLTNKEKSKRQNEKIRKETTGL